MVRNFVAIPFLRLKEKPVRLSTQHYCVIKSYTICKPKFPLKMISIAFEANPDHVLKLNDFRCGRFEGNLIQRFLNVYFCVVNIKPLSWSEILFMSF